MPAMVTGHRKLVPIGHTGSPWPQQNPRVKEHHLLIFNKITEWLTKYIIFHYESGLGRPQLITGMALGADQIFAQAVLFVKKCGVDAHLIAAVPFKGQESKWPAYSQDEYKGILSKCDEVVYVCDPGYAAWKMQRRNEWMVGRAERILAVWDGNVNGGTANCVNYAGQKGRFIDILNPNTLEIKVEE